MSSSDKQRKVDKKTEYAVYGYCRNIGAHVFIAEIVDICVDFYNDPEEFDEDHNYHGMVIDKDDKSIVYNGSGVTWTTIFGKTIIKSNEIFAWDFKIIGKPESITNSWKIAIGVVPASFKKTTNSSFTFIAPNYGFIGSNSTLAGNGKRNKVKQQFGEEEGDELRMILNLREYKLSYVINGQDNGYCIEKLRIENYRMAVSLCRGRKLKLICAGWL